VNAAELHPVIRRMVTAQRIAPGTLIDLTPRPLDELLAADVVILKGRATGKSEAAPVAARRPEPRPLLSLAVQPPPARDTSASLSRAGQVGGQASGSRLYTCACGRELKGSGARNSHMRRCPKATYTPGRRPRDPEAVRTYYREWSRRRRERREQTA